MVLNSSQTWSVWLLCSAQVWEQETGQEAAEAQSSLRLDNPQAPSYATPLRISPPRQLVWENILSSSKAQHQWQSSRWLLSLLCKYTRLQGTRAPLHSTSSQAPG